MFNSASARAALKLKYKPKIVDGKAVPVDGVLHRFTYVLDEG
jgi:protein TonB